MTAPSHQQGHPSWTQGQARLASLIREQTLSHRRHTLSRGAHGPCPALAGWRSVLLSGSPPARVQPHAEWQRPRGSGCPAGWGSRTVGHREQQSWLSLIPTSPNPAHIHWPPCGPNSPAPPVTPSSLGRSGARPWGPHRGHRGGKDRLAVPGGRQVGDGPRGALRLLLHSASFRVYCGAPPTLSQSAGGAQASPGPRAGRQPAPLFLGDPTRFCTWAGPSPPLPSRAPPPPPGLP